MLAFQRNGFSHYGLAQCLKQHHKQFWPEQLHDLNNKTELTQTAISQQCLEHPFKVIDAPWIVTMINRYFKGVQNFTQCRESGQCGENTDHGKTECLCREIDSCLVSFHLYKQDLFPNAAELRLQTCFYSVGLTKGKLTQHWKNNDGPVILKDIKTVLCRAAVSEWPAACAYGTFLCCLPYLHKYSLSVYLQDFSWHSLYTLTFHQLQGVHYGMPAQA